MSVSLEKNPTLTGQEFLHLRDCGWQIEANRVELSGALTRQKVKEFPLAEIWETISEAYYWNGGQPLVILS